MADRRSLGSGLALILVAAAGTLAVGHAVPPPVARAVANPADGLVGQRVTACNYHADLEIVVVQAEARTAVVGETAPGTDLWIVAIIDVTNVSDKAEALTTRPLQLRDERGRVYEVREDPPDPVDLARAYGVHPAFEDFQPGVTERSVVTFLVTEDVGPLTLTGKRDFC